MTKKSGWDLLQSGNFRGAIKVLRQEHKSRPSKGTLNNLGVAYLCLGDGHTAKKFFDEALAMPLPDTGTHALAGVTRWVLGERADAVRMWTAGLDCEYRDYAGGMELPLLLFYAAARDPAVYAMGQARNLIREALKSSWAENWPGPLGRFVLKQIDEKEARREAEFDQPEVMARQMNELEFYAGVIAYLAGNDEQFMDRMRRCALTPRCEVSNEWYLARYEVNSRGA
jgi:tetratricopeptide (TPR) repeat protein